MENCSEIKNMIDYTSWKKRTILFISGQSISLFGSSLVQYIIIWYITLSTASGSMMTIATICGFLPQLIIGLFAGVWADRYNRKHIIILADSFIAISTLVVALLFMFGYQEIWLLFIVLGFRSLGGGIQSPSISALIPQLVPTDKLMKVNGINTSLNSLILLLSPAIGGIILTFYPLQIALFIDVITALFGVGILATIKITKIRIIDAKVTTYLKDLGNGIRYISKNHLVKLLIIFTAIFYFAVTPAAMLTPLLVARNYGTEVWRLTINEISFSAGAIIGGMIIAYWGGFNNRLILVCLGFIIIGILNLAIGFNISFILFMIFIFAMGIIVPFVGSSITVLLQERIEKDIQGRVFGFYNIITVSAFPLGMALFGPLADIVSIESLLIVTGILITILGLFMSINKKFINLGKCVKIEENNMLEV